MNESSPSSNIPSHYVYSIRDRKDKKGIWTRIGAAWPQKGGFVIQLDALPIDDRIVVHVASEAKA